MLRALRIQSSTKHGSSVQIEVLIPLSTVCFSVAFHVAVSEFLTESLLKEDIVLTVVQGAQSVTVAGMVESVTGNISWESR